MDKLKGKKMLFKVQAVIGPHALYDGSYRVRRVCIDEAIIELFLTDDEIYSPSKALNVSLDDEVIDTEKIVGSVDASHTEDFVS